MFIMLINKKNTMRKIFYTATASIMLVPFIVQGVTIRDELLLVVAYINIFIPFLTVLGTLYVVWGVFQFIRSAGDEKAVTEGRNRIVFGIVGLFVMISIWGFVNLLVNSLKLPSDTIPKIPLIGSM